MLSLDGMKVKELRDGKAEWQKFLKANGGGILQTYEWGEFRRELGWKARHVVVLENDQIRLAAMVLQKPLPGGYCFFYCPEGPIVKDADWRDSKNQQAFEHLTAYLKSHTGKELALFLKIDPHVEAASFPTDWLAKKGFRDSPEDIQSAVVTHVDLTPDEDAILAGMKQKGRYNIRYATKKGVKVRAGKSEQDLDVFYSLLEPTAKRQGISYRSKRYYQTFRRHFMEGADYARFFIAEKDGVPLAATLVTFFGKEAIYLYGGSAPQDRNIYASYLVQWEAMKAAKAKGCTFYNMTGIAATDDPNEQWAGLRQFKLKFGGPVIHLLGAWDYPYAGFRYRAFTTLDRIRRAVASRVGM